MTHFNSWTQRTRRITLKVGAGAKPIFRAVSQGTGSTQILHAIISFRFRMTADLLELRTMACGEKLRFAVQGNGEVSALLVRPPNAPWLLVLGHGAGAGMVHPFLERLVAELAKAGLVFFGFPLHPPKRPGTKRAEHLAKVSVPMLFLQGTRDTLADLTLLRPICADLGSRAALHIIPEADHSFHVPQKSGKTDAEVMTELAQTTAAWANRLNDRGEDHGNRGARA